MSDDVYPTFFSAVVGFLAFFCMAGIVLDFERYLDKGKSQVSGIAFMFLFDGFPLFLCCTWGWWVLLVRCWWGTLFCLELVSYMNGSLNWPCGYSIISFMYVEFFKH